jgi:hypothetical protein
MVINILTVSLALPLRKAGLTLTTIMTNGTFVFLYVYLFSLRARVFDMKQITVLM